jgi:RHS repeat-associated protein
MLVAGKWFDPVIGIDIHLILTPAGVTVPVPHPFIGFVFDPAGLAVGMAIGAAISGLFGGPFKGPVFINGMPAANTGTEVKGMPVHIPIGGTFVNPPSNEGTIITGSKTVDIMGSSAARLTSLVMTCNDPVNLPTSVVMAIPMGPPVLIGGPTGVDLLAALLAGIRTKWVSDKLHGLLKAKPGSWRSKIICFFTGHPVDVATGRVLTDHTDLALPGLIPLKFERNYYSASTYDGPLGHGWHHSFDQQITVSGAAAILRSEDGREIEFDGVDEGAPVYEPIERLELRREGRDFLVSGQDGRTLRFGPRRGDNTFPLASIEDPNGNKILLKYEGRDLVAIVDSVGRVLGLSHDRLGRLVSLEVPAPDGPGRLTAARFEYDAAGDLVAAYDALGHADRYAYSHHRLVRETDRNGLSFYFEYDADGPDGWCVHTWGDGGIYDHKIFYQKQAHITVVEDSLGAKTTYICNDAGLVTAIIDPAGGRRAFEWDECCRKVAETDANGHTTRFEYDSRGRQTAVVDALGRRRETRYDAVGNSVSWTDEAGSVWRHEHDGRRNVVALLDPEGKRWEYQVDRRGLPVVATDPGGKQFRLTWDDRANLCRVVDRASAEVVLEHDALGRLIRRRDALGARTTLTWDSCGRPTGSSDEVGVARRYRYDPGGNILEAWDRAGGLRRYRYGPRGLLASVEVPSGGGTHYRYDRESRLVAVEDAQGRAWTFERDALGRVITERTFEGRLISHQRDPAGHVLATTIARGRRIRFGRDPVGRLVSRTFGDGTSEQFEYNSRGFLVKAENPAAEVVFEYDALGRKLSESINGQTTRRAYDALGHLISRTSPYGRTLRMSYDAQGRLQGVSDPAGPLMSLEYDAAGRELRRTLPGGVVCDRRYATTGGGLLASHTRRGDLTLAVREYQYDQGGRLTELRDDSFGPTQYDYDADGSLIAAEYPGGVVDRFLYDAAGNVPGIPEGMPPAPATGSTVEAGGWSLRYDGNGDLVEKSNPASRHRYDYDASGRLERVMTDGREAVEFAYDPLGRRIMKRTADATVHYLWDGDVPVGEQVRRPDEGTESHLEFLFRPDSFEPMAVLGDDGAFLLECDRIGTPWMALDREGGVAWRAHHRAFGMVRAERGPGPGIPFRFPGQTADQETGLHYNRFRYYDPELRLFTSPDPLGLDGGLEIYNYARDPAGWVDPYGLECKIYTVESLEPNRAPQIGMELTQAEAEAFLRHGGDVLIAGGSRREKKELARALAEAAGTPGSTMFHGRTASAGPGSLAHHHPVDAAGKLPGHVFIDDPGRLQSPFH